jgi:hypothetical protein
MLVDSFSFNEGVTSIQNSIISSIVDHFANQGVTVTAEKVSSVIGETIKDAITDAYFYSAEIFPMQSKGT